MWTIGAFWQCQKFTNGYLVLVPSGWQRESVICESGSNEQTIKTHSDLYRPHQITATPLCGLTGINNNNWML